MTPRALARKVVTTRRFLRWRVLVDGRVMASLPASIAGQTEETALAKARHLFPGREVRVEGVRCA